MVQLAASGAGRLDAWIDWGRDGGWAEAADHIATSYALSPGVNTLVINVPITAQPGVTFARLRFSSLGNLNFDGPAADGEVEDYALQIEPLADLAITKLDSPDPAGQGGNLTYSITVTNAGPNAAANVQVVDSLPAGVNFISAIASAGSCSQAMGVVTCNLGTLAAGATASVTLLVSPSQCSGTFMNVATVSSSTADSNPGNNSAAASTTVIDMTAPVHCNNPVVTATHGTVDNYVGGEPSSPRAELLEHLPGVDLRGYDEGCFDSFLADSFTGLPADISAARLRIKLRACTGLPENDSISLVFATAGGVLRPERWVRRIGTFSGVPGVLPTPWMDGNETELVLDLSRLPNVSGAPTDLIPVLAELRYLDLYIQDDTLVDYIRLEVETCHCRDDITLTAVSGSCTAPATFALPTFTDNCDPNPGVTCTPASGSQFVIGTTMVNCLAVDASGNRGHCSFSVTVVQNPADQPILSIRRESRTNNVVIISWPAACNGNFTLEQTDNLNDPRTWVPTPDPVVLQGGRFSVRRAAVPNMRYYRLRKP
jgi:uncharacterized repeat protein (TIGR01451 family)